MDGKQLDRLLGTIHDVTGLAQTDDEGERDTILARLLGCCRSLLDADTSGLHLIQKNTVRFWTCDGSKVRKGVCPRAKAGTPVPHTGPVLGAWLGAQEHPLGFLEVVRAVDPRPYDSEDRKILTALARQTALALQQSVLHTRLKQEALIDGLTGIYNYKSLMQALGAEVNRAGRYGHTLAFVMADVDHLKSYNERFGHIAGSDVLAHVARLLAQNCRASDIVGKYGGDEFALILPETGIEGAMAVAERIRVAIAQETFRHVQRGEITCSFGVATFPGDGKESSELIRQADHRLFCAKRSGKNTIRASDAEPTPNPI